VPRLPAPAADATAVDVVDPQDPLDTTVLIRRRQAVSGAAEARAARPASAANYLP
jgi:hypothetical protein